MKFIITGIKYLIRILTILFALLLIVGIFSWFMKMWPMVILIIGVFMCVYVCIWAWEDTRE